MLVGGRARVEDELQHGHPGNLELAPSASTGGVITPRSSAISGRRPERRAGGEQRRGAAARAASGPARASRAPAGTAQ